jgi:hypothetical protein
VSDNAGPGDLADRARPGLGSRRVPDRPSAADRALRVASLALVLAVGAIGTLTHLGLFADGAYFFHQILVGDHAFVANPGRSFVTVITQVPLLLGLRLGVTDLTTLTILHSAGLTLVASTVWFLALWLQRERRTFWVFLAMWSGTYLVAGFFAIGEYNLTYALAALAASLLLAPGGARVPRALTALVVGIALLRSYESMIFLGPALAVVTLLMHRSARTARGAGGSRVAGVVAWLTSAVFLLAAGLALAWLLAPEHVGVTGGALDARYLLHNSRLVVGGAAAVALAGTLLLRTAVARRASAAFAVLSTAVLVVPHWSVLVPGMPGPVGSLDPWMSYQARVAVSGVQLLLIALALLMTLAPGASPVRERDALPRLSAGVPAAVLAIVFVTMSARFGAWLGDYRELVNSTHGLIPLEQSGLDPIFTWTWTDPVLSLDLWSGPDRGIVDNFAGYGGWQPFDPTQAPALPERYLGGGH